MNGDAKPMRKIVHVVEITEKSVNRFSSRLLKKSTECFESLSMNGILSIISNLFPFVLSPSKDSERVFQQPANEQKFLWFATN